MDIVFVDSVSQSDYLRMDDSDGSEVAYPNAFHLLITIPADRREDVDRNDTTRRELTGIIDAAIATIEGG